MYSTFFVTKSQCMACNNEVIRLLGTLTGVFAVEVNRVNGQVVVTHTDEVSRVQMAQVLAQLGWVETKESDGLEPDEPSIWGCAL